MTLQIHPRSRLRIVGVPDGAKKDVRWVLVLLFAKCDSLVWSNIPCRLLLRYADFRVAQTVSDTMPYGLFALLYQGATSVGAFNTTAAVPYSSSPVTSTSWMAAVATSVIALSSMFA